MCNSKPSIGKEYVLYYAHSFRCGNFSDLGSGKELFFEHTVRLAVAPQLDCRNELLPDPSKVQLLACDATGALHRTKSATVLRIDAQDLAVRARAVDRDVTRSLRICNTE